MNMFMWAVRAMGALFSTLSGLEPVASPGAATPRPTISSEPEHSRLFTAVAIVSAYASSQHDRHPLAFCRGSSSAAVNRLDMAYSRDDVLASVRAIFPNSDWTGVVGVLDQYGLVSYERERERVQLAILKLCEGSEEKLRDYVDVKRDYRFCLGGISRRSPIDTPESARWCTRCSRNWVDFHRPGQ
jgi:hypothetical protein